MRDTARWPQDETASERIHAKYPEVQLSVYVKRKSYPGSCVTVTMRNSGSRTHGWRIKQTSNYVTGRVCIPWYKETYGRKLILKYRGWIVINVDATLLELSINYICLDGLRILGMETGMKGNFIRFCHVWSCFCFIFSLLK